MNVAYSLWSAYLFLALGITADGFFVPALTRIADNWSLSDNVAGVTLVALGNGSPGMGLPKCQGSDSIQINRHKYGPFGL